MKKLYYKVKALSEHSSNFMEVEVYLVNKKEKFGRVLCEIEPVKGTGTIWVNEETLIVK